MGTTNLSLEERTIGYVLRQSGDCYGQGLLSDIGSFLDRPEDLAKIKKITSNETDQESLIADLKQRNPFWYSGSFRFAKWLIQRSIAFDYSIRDALLDAVENPLECERERYPTAEGGIHLPSFFRFYHLLAESLGLESDFRQRLGTFLDWYSSTIDDCYMRFVVERNEPPLEKEQRDALESLSTTDSSEVYESVRNTFLEATREIIQRNRQALQDVQRTLSLDFCRVPQGSVTGQLPHDDGFAHVIGVLATVTKEDLQTYVETYGVVKEPGPNNY